MSNPIEAIQYDAKMITEQYLEITWNENSAPASREEAMTLPVQLTVNGTPVSAEPVAYFDGRLTMKLADPVTDPDSAEAAVCLQGTCIPAPYIPWYTFRKELAPNATAVRKNQGTKSKLWVLGNESSGCTAANPRYTAAYVIEYCTEGINKVTGRSDYLTLAAANNDLTVVVVGDGVSVYEVPEYRHLYCEADAHTRTVIPGSRELPIIVTTARDVMRQKSENNDTFEMLYAFGLLYWELGVKDGCPLFPLSVYDDADTYNYVKHLEDAYAHAKEEGLWPGTRMMESLEEYFAWATLVWYMAIGESADGSWQEEHFPVNTRCELRDYDPQLYGVLVEIYGEFEYFSGYREQHTVDSDDALREDFPWYKHNQIDNYNIEGKPYEPLRVEECNLAAGDQIELIFNREVRDIAAIRRPEAWRVCWEKADGETVVFAGDQIRPLLYQWKTLTLQIPGQKLYHGYMGSDVTGFTEEEMRQAEDPESPDYKPWFRDVAYARSLDGVVVSPTIYKKVLAGTRRPCPDEENPVHEFTLAPKITVEANPGAIEKGVYINFADASTIPERLRGGIDGRIIVTFLGEACDWADNRLGQEPMTVKFRPWLSQVMRSEKRGVYVYGDPYVKPSTLALCCEYWDRMLNNDRLQIGQRIADGLVYGHGGAEIMSYHHHAYQMTGMRVETCEPNHHFYLYVEGFGGGICQTTEANLIRKCTYTRYDNEFILGHEGAHSIEITGMPYFTDMNYLVQEAYASACMDQDLWNHGGLSYAGSNRAEYFATLSNIWHSTMRESADGTNNGTWLPINTREELYVYDRAGYEMCKRTYYCGRVGVNADAVNAAIARGEIHLTDEKGDPILHFVSGMYLPGWDRQGNSINDELIRWGSTFPAGEMRRLDEKMDRLYGEDTYVRWVSWSTPNQWDINDRHELGSGIRYGEDPAARYDRVNYNPYLEA